MNRLPLLIRAGRRYLGGLALLFSGLAGLPAGAQSTNDVQAFSIKDCINYASQNNSNVKISRLDEQIAQQDVNEVRGRGLPQINISGSFTDNLKLPVSLLPAEFFGGEPGTFRPLTFGTKYIATGTGEVTQMIVSPSFWIGLKAARYSSRLSQQNTQATSEQEVFEIANAYYQVIVQQKQLDLLRSNLVNTEKTLATTELQFKNGVAKRVDVNRLQVNFNNLQSQIKQAELNLVQVSNRLKFEMGMPIEKQIVLSDTAINFREEDAVLNEPTGNYFENRIDYKRLETNLSLQELNRKNEIAGYFPQLSAFANYQYQAQRNEFNFTQSGKPWFQSAAVGLRLNIPIFDGLQRNARVQKSKLSIEQVKENINLTKQSINLEVSNALTQYRNTLQRIENEQQNVQLAEEVYRVTQLEFREGVSTSTDVVNSETALRQAQTTYITTLLDLYTARLDLERAKGNLLPYLTNR